LFVFCFAENEVDIEALLCLTEDNIQDLIPKIGLRAKFNNKLNEYKKLYNQETNDTQVGLHGYFVIEFNF
jgi:hypothetical protein